MRHVEAGEELYFSYSELDNTGHMTHGVRHGVQLEQLLARDVPHGEHAHRLCCEFPLQAVAHVKKTIHGGVGGREARVHKKFVPCLSKTKKKIGRCGSSIERVYAATFCWTTGSCRCVLFYSILRAHRPAHEQRQLLRKKQNSRSPRSTPCSYNLLGGGHHPRLRADPVRITA